MTVNLSDLIQQILIILVPLLGLSLPGILKKDGYAAWLNGAISGLVVFLAAAGEVYVGGKLTGNIYADTALFAIALSSLLAGPLKPLDEFLQARVNILPGGKVQPGQPAPAPQTFTIDIGALATEVAQRVASFTVAAHPTVQTPSVQTPVSQIATAPMPTVAPIPQYPTAQVPAIDPNTFPTLTFDIPQGGQS